MSSSADNESVPLKGSLTSGSLWWRCFAFGGPLAVGMMGMGLFNVVDLIIVGRVGEGAISSVTISGIVLTVVMLMFDGVSNITVALTAQGHSSGRKNVVHDVAWESFWLTIACGVVFGALFYLGAEVIVSAFEFKNPDTVSDAVIYLQVMAAGTITMFLIMQTTAVLRGVGNAFWPMVILVGSNVLNVILDIALVFGVWGFPKMGVAGAAWATVIARGAGAALGFWLLWRGIDGISMRKNRFRGGLKYVKSLLFVGLPTSTQLAIRVLSIFFITIIGSKAYAGSTEAFMDGVGVCIRMEMVAVFLGLGWGAGATAIVGQSLGARQVRRADRSTWILVLYGVVSMGLVGASLWWWRTPLLAFVGPEVSPEGVTQAVDYLKITIPFYAVMAVSPVISRALNGAGSTRTPMVIDFILFFAILLPLADWLSGAGWLFDGFRKETPVVTGVWWASVTMHAVSAVAYASVWRAGSWRRKKLKVLEDAVD